MRPLEELRAEWLRHRVSGKTSAEDSSQRRHGVPARGGQKGISGSSGPAAAASRRPATPNDSVDKHTKGIPRSDVDRPVDPTFVAPKAGTGSCGDHPDRGGVEGQSAANHKLDAVYVRQKLLCMRPRPGQRPDVGLPKVLAMASEAQAEACLQKDGPSEAPNGEKPGTNILLDEAFEWCLDDIKDVDDEPGGVEESRGFSKWFAAGVTSRKSTESGDGGLTGEVGILTDTGTCTGVGDSSTEEDEEEA